MNGVGGALGAILSRESSWRRLLAFLISSGLLVGGYLSEDTWVWVALAFVGAESATRLAETGARKRSKATETAIRDEPPQEA